MALKDKISTAKTVLADTKSRMIVIILVIIVVIVLGIAYVKFKRSGVAPAGLGSSLSSAPNIASIPGLGKPTREYAKLQEQQNQELAVAAARKGTSAMPTIVRTTYLDTGVSNDLSKGSGATSTSGCSIEDLKRARASGVDVSELRCRGCSLAALKAAGYSAGGLKSSGFSAKELKDIGFSPNDLKNTGFDAKNLAAAGFNANELSSAGFSVGELKQAGFSDADLKKAGFDDKAIKAVSDGLNSGACSIRKIQAARSGGADAASLRKLGCSVAALKAAGYTAEQLKAAGFSAGELRNAGFSAKELKDAGFSAQELRRAGFSAGDLSDAGFTPAELAAAGYTKGDLVRAGVVPNSNEDVKPVNLCSVENLKKEREKGVKASKLIDLGCSLSALKAAGFNIPELKAAGLSSDELRAVGFPISKPKKDPNEIKTKGDVHSLQDNIQDNIEKLKDDRVVGMTDQELSDFARQQQAMMMMQANQLFASWTPIPSQQYVEGEPPKEVHSVSENKLTAEQKKELELKNNDIFKAGNIIFATLDTGVDSDETTPVMATVVHGPLKGSKVIGNFQRVDKKILLQFSVLSVPRLTKSMGINAVAVDPDTAKTAMASSVDNHYMLRYGTMMASAFVSGLGQSFQNAGGQIQTTNTGTVSTMPALTTAQKTIVAFGNMAQQVSNTMAPNINKPPTVKVNAGVSIGLLLMADLMVPKK